MTSCVAHVTAVEVKQTPAEVRALHHFNGSNNNQFVMCRTTDIHLAGTLLHFVLFFHPSKTLDFNFLLNSVTRMISMSYF